MQALVNILLTTYNGSKFLREQLESFDAQTLQPERVTIRDDGSTDDTNSLVETWAAARPGVTLLRGERLGVTNNFFALLAHRDDESEYFAFSDQDDVWLPNKIERAVAALGKFPADIPAMYCTRVEYVDENLQHLGYSRIPKGTGFGNALVENIATGCTMMLNRSARELVCTRIPEKAIIHDWWCYMAVSAFGQVIYDERPSIRYRQHANNLTGGTPSIIELFRRRFVRFLKQRKGALLVSDQAADFERCFGERLPAEHRRTLKRFLLVREGLKERISYSAGMDVWRQSSLDTAILRALIVMGRT
jgi:glycosyltransferase involved in cell wall biosynthesis